MPSGYGRPEDHSDEEESPMREVVVTGIGYTIAAGFVALGDRVTVTGRRATPSDVADTVLFLASEGARHLTGQVLHVNGGAYLGR
jgi:NAD(P)-dependent dehydrogenase (short-subunit alcohol dehydrogenase family)